MHTRISHHLLLLVFLLISNFLFAQNYPVTCTPIVKPSFSLKWSEISTSTEMFKVHLLLKDLTKPSVDVYLKIRLSGVGVDIRTVDGFIPSQTIHLNPGSATLLTSADLAEYFNISNLAVDGIDISTLYAGGRLPEGLYTWTVEAYEIDRDRQVSNTGMALMNVFKNYPPIINIPQDGAILPVTNPQNILFSWTSRSTASLNAAQGKTFKLRIYPLNTGEDPNMVANSGIQPIEITTTTPYFNYGAANIPLEKGKRYAVQVQEEDINGFDDYENEGKSQVVNFSFGQPCLAPEGLIINPIEKGRVELTWEQNDETSTTVWYKQSRSNVWNNLTVEGKSTVVSNLKDKTTYEFKASSNCGANTKAFGALDNSNPVIGEPSSERIEFIIDDSIFDEKIEEVDWVAFHPAILDPYSIKVELLSDGTSIKPKSVADIFEKIIKPKCANNTSSYEECSIDHPKIPIPTGEDLTSLAIGDVLGIYDYAVLVTEVGGGNAFSGKGLVKLPFLDGAFMAVEFSGVKIKKGEEGTHGGCVYEVPDAGYFRNRNISQGELQNEQIKTIADIIKLTDPTIFHGDLEATLLKYKQKGEEIAINGTATPQEKQDLLTYTKGIEVAINTWKEKFAETFAEESNPKISEIMDDIKAIITQLNADKQTIENGNGYPIIPNLKEKIDAIIEKIKVLQEEQKPKLPKIQNVLASNISYNDATITWQGDPHFTKYVISYKTADGGELIETTNSNRLLLKNLQENSVYRFKIEGYVDEKLVDNYNNGTFTTLQNKLPIPENVKQVKVNDNTLTLTWDKNKLHDSYKVVYKDKKGIISIVFPKSNTVTLKDLVPDENYEYSIVAVGNNTESDPAKGDFTSSLCHGLIEITTTRIIEGSTITLSASSSCIDNISWGNVTLTNQRSINVTPNETTTYELSCTVEFKNGETKVCNDKVKITVEKKCSDVVARATTYDITQSEEVGLIVKGCSSDVIWKDEKLTTVNTNKIWLNVPSKPQTYSVYCKNTEGNTCAFQLPTININCQIKLLENDNDADENVWGTPSGSKMITLLGCENGIVDWDFSKEGQINGKEIKPNQFLISNIKRSREAKIKASCTRFGQKCETEELTITRPNVLCGEYAGSNPHTLSIEDGKIKIVSKWYNNEANANCSSIKWSDGTLSNSNSGVNHIKYFSIPSKPAVFEGIAFVYGSGDNNRRECPFNIPYNPVIKEVQDNIIPEVICTPFVATASKTNFDCDDKIQLSSKWCGVTETNTGIVTWEPEIPLTGIVTPTVKEITYKATCQFDGHTVTSEVTLRRNPPKLFVGLSDKSYNELFFNNILAGKTVSLQSWGCYNDNCQSGTVEYYYQYYSLNGQALGFNKVTNNTILINGTYRSIDFKAKCLISGAEASTKKFEIYVPNPCDFNALVDDGHNNPPNVQDGLASIKISGCDLGTLSWKNSKGGHGDINISTMKIEDNNSGSVAYQITCHLNGNVSTQPFCDKEVIIYRPETKPIITDETKCSDFFKEDTYTYKLSVASGVTGSEPTYTPKEKALFAGILTSSNEVQVRLASSNCPSNIVTWYDSEGKKIGDKSMITIAFPSKSPATYTSECSMTTNNGKPLKCTTKVSITFNLEYIIELNKILKNDRVSTLQTTELSNTQQDNIVNEASENANCGFMTTQKAVGDILKNLICDNNKLVMEAPITNEKVEIIKNTILENPIFQEKGISLPPISDAMILEIASDKDKCKTAIDGLIKDIEGNSLKEDFNTLAIDPNLIDEVVENIQNNFAISLSNPDINTTAKTYKIGQYSVTFYIDVEKVGDYYQINGKQYAPLYYAGSKGFIGFYDKDILATITPNEKGEYPKGVLDSKGAWLLPSATTYKVESYQTLVETTIPTLQSDFLEPFATYWKALHKCTDTEFKAYEEGIVPECFWHGVGNPNFAQLAGLIDETYRTGVGFGKFTKPFNNIDDLLREYLLGITCEDELWGNIKKIDKLENEIRKLNYDADIINFVVEQWKNEQIETLAEDIAACDEYVNFKQKLPQFADIVLNWDTWAKTFENLPDNIDKYVETFAKDLDNVGTLNDLQNYAIGKRLFEVGSIFATAGGANAAEVGVNTLRNLPKLPKNIPLRIIEQTSTEIKVIAEGEATDLFIVNKEGVYTTNRWFTSVGGITTKVDELSNVHYINKVGSFQTGTIDVIEDASGKKWFKPSGVISRYANYPNIQKLATHVLDEVDNLADDLLPTLEADLTGNSALKIAFESDVDLVDIWKLIKEPNAELVKKVGKIINTRKTNPIERIKQLGKDLDKGEESIIEGEAGFEIEERYGYFERYKAIDNTTKGDWISLSGQYRGKTFDETGGGIAEMAISEFARKPSQKRKFFESLDIHFLKPDYVVLNLTNMKRLEPTLYAETIDYITNKFGTNKLINITK
ncbi:fibronectin type III domain-containing protein [Emticicia sp. SJ17W-69]|uniref:fibronectin type III domain-containing protein n=1 Tax=Emticicia sp. SJ17W-69 TaxID=3421657 RepID=UPI003EBBE8F8